MDCIFEHQRSVKGATTVENNLLHVMDNRARIAIVRAGNALPDDGAPNVKEKYHLGDHLGSSNLIVDGAGSWINREEYLPYGETSFGSFARKRYRFTSKERDNESGLYYHGARYFSPWLGIWINCDPLGLGEHLSLYAYARNTPLKYTDVTGAQSSASAEQGNQGAASVSLPLDMTQKEVKEAARQFRKDPFSIGGLKALFFAFSWAYSGTPQDAHGNALSSEELSAMQTKNLLRASGYAMGFGFNTVRGLTGGDVSVQSVKDEKVQNALAMLPLVGRLRSALSLSREMVTAASASQDMLAWGTAWDARRAAFVSATNTAQTATGTSAQLGQVGVNLARPLYGGSNAATEVTVEVGRRMDIAPPMPLNTRPEWEIKLVQPRNLSGPRVASERIRDIARQQRYGANAEIGWLSWKGFPAGQAQKLQQGGIITVDAPQMAAEFNQPGESLWGSLVRYLSGGGKP